MPAAPQARASVRPAFRSASAVGLFLIVSGVTLAADLVSKHVVFEELLSDANSCRRMESILADHPEATQRDLLGVFRRDLIPGVRLTLSANPYVVFGIDTFPRWAVNGATVLAIVLVSAMFAWSDRRAWPTHLAMGLILAGAIGNLYDRLFSEIRLPGTQLFIRQHVRDFIDLSRLHYPYVFNIADALLVIGVGILMLEWVLHARSAAAKSAPPKTAK
jgi:lipoprotein signal peptidase